MPILRDWKCDDCGHEFESMEDKPLCPLPRPEAGDTCHGLCHALPVATKSYSIHGDNSASITPKKHRKEAP